VMEIGSHAKVVGTRRLLSHTIVKQLNVNDVCLKNAYKSIIEIDSTWLSPK